MATSGYGSETMTAETVEERWTSTTVHAVFALPPLSRKPRDGAISVELPLMNLGWTFALLLSPEYRKEKSTIVRKPGSTYKWNPVVFAFHPRGKVIPWGNAFIDAELSLTTAGPPAPNDSTPLDANDTPPCPSNNSTLLVTMKKIALVPSHSLEIKTARCTLSLRSRSKISLTLTISECPFARGLFRVKSGAADEAEAQKRLAKQGGNSLLSRSFTTGRVYDVRFLACSGSNDESLLVTYAWLSILEEHINPSLARPNDAWTSALAALSCHENRDAKPLVEIPCPDGYEYELDSDFDEDEAVEPVTSVLPGEHDPDTLQGEESGSKTEGLGSPFSSFERDGVSDVSSLDSLPEEFIKDQEVSPRSPSKTIADCERTIVIKFAAHRTWHAFLWYCYTGHIDFRELKSQIEHGVQSLRIVGDSTPSCSPKSMYRLADLIGDKDLKVLALKAIRERMTKTNVLEEMLSVFTSKYPDVREAQLDVLMEHRASLEVKKAFLEKIFESGVMPHAKPALEGFYDRLAAMSLIKPAISEVKPGRNIFYTP